MKKIIRSTLRLNEQLDYNIKLLANKNRVSENKMKEYLLELGIQVYFQKFDDYFMSQNKMLLEEKNEEINNNI